MSGATDTADDNGLDVYALARRLGVDPFDLVACVKRHPASRDDRFSGAVEGWTNEPPL